MNINSQYLLIKMLNKLLKKGYSLNESLNMMDNLNKKTIILMKTQLEEGLALSTVFKKLKFKRFVFETLMIGERSNRLNEVVNLVEESFAFYLKVKAQMNKVLLYPVVLLLFALVCFEFIRINLYPVILSLLSDFDAAKNEVLIFLAFNMLKIIGLAAVILYSIASVFKKLPNILPQIKLYRSIYLTNNIIILLTCGNSLEQSLSLIKGSMNERIYPIDELEKALFLDGYRFPALVPFNPVFIKYLRLGIKANDLVTVLSDFRSVYTDLLFDKLNKMTYYMQFALFSLLSVNIFLIYYLLMMPMLNLKF